MENQNIGMIIREERKKLGLKVYELAKMVGVDPVYITRIEKHNRMPSIIVYLNIEKFLKLPPSLRAQYYNEKNPEIVKHWPTYELDEIFGAGPSNSLHASPVVRIINYINSYPLKEIKSFLIGLFKDIDPNYNLSDKEIKEYTSMLKTMAKNKHFSKVEYKKMYAKLNAINNFMFPNLGEGGPEYLKRGFL